MKKNVSEREDKKQSIFIRPYLCGSSNEDLECLGCGWKLGYCRLNGICGAEEDHKRKQRGEL